VAPFFLTVISQVFKIPFYDNAGGFQYKDAGAWANCTKALALTGSFLSDSGEWCLRRPLFPELISLLYRLENSIFFVSATLSIIFGASLLFLFSETKQFLSAFWRFQLCFVTLCYWFIFCCNQILTESLGIIFGVTALALLLKARTTSNIKYVYLSIVLFGILQQIRPGNLFLPLAPIVLLIMGRFKDKIVYVLIGFVFFFSPYLLTGVLRKLTALSNYANSGNAWASLYGLANNNSSWQEAYGVPGIPAGATDAQISEVVKGVTLDLIISSPFSIPRSILQNLTEMITTFFPFISPISVPLAVLAVGLNIMTLIFLVIKIRFKSSNQHYGKSDIYLIGFILISTVFFYSITWKSEPARALMPSISVTIFVFFYLCFGSKVDPVEFDSTTNKKFQNLTLSIPKNALSALSLLLSVLVLSFTSHSLQPSRDLLNSEKCSEGSFSFINSSLSITNVEEIKSLKLYSWGADVPKLDKGFLIQGLAINESKTFAINSFFKSDQSTFEYQDKCFVFSEEGPNLGGFTDSGVKSIRLF
jgi:hypothetical protein